MSKTKNKPKANAQKSNKRTVKRITLNERELRQLKKTVTEDATKKAILLVLSTCVDELQLDGEALEKLVNRIDQRNGWLNDERVIELRDMANSIYSTTGIDFRSW